MIINIKQKFMEILPEPVPEGFMNFLNSLKEDDYIITVPTNDVRTTTTQSSLNQIDIINETNQMIDDIYLNFVRINNLSELERKNIETIINNLQNLIMKIINSFNEHILTLTSDITNLKKK
jgi:hypothetical protein